MSMQNKKVFGLPVHVLNDICDVFRKHHNIKKVILYGSRAMGNYRLGSDIDLCVEADGMELTQLLAIENQIDDLLLPWKVDLSSKHQIDNPDLLHHIQCVGIEIYPNFSIYF